MDSFNIDYAVNFKDETSGQSINKETENKYMDILLPKGGQTII